MLGFLISFLLRRKETGRVGRRVIRITPKAGLPPSFSASMDRKKDNKHGPTPPGRAKPNSKERSTLEMHPPHKSNKSDPKDEGQRHTPGTASQKRKRRVRLCVSKRQSVRGGNKNPKKTQKHAGAKAVAFQETGFHQEGGKTVVPKLPFFPLIREILQTNHPNLRIQSLAVQALQEAAEAYIISVMEMVNLCSMHVIA